MKKRFIICIILVLTVFISCSQAPNKMDVEQLIQRELKIALEEDADSIEFYVALLPKIENKNGVFAIGSVYFGISGVMELPLEQIVKSVAYPALSNYYGKKFFDTFMSLKRVNGEWQINSFYSASIEMKEYSNLKDFLKDMMIVSMKESLSDGVKNTINKLKKIFSIN
jgi:hypothetical protein